MSKVLPRQQLLRLVVVASSSSSSIGSFDTNKGGAIGEEGETNSFNNEGGEKHLEFELFSLLCV